MVSIGIDEVGRGAWAGPLLVCAVKLVYPVKGLTDSKKLPRNKRNILAKEIMATNPVGFGWVSNDEIDDIGLALSLRLAAARAIEDIVYASEIIITDGTIPLLPLMTTEQTRIKADLTVPAVSAASIVAKVARDNRMAEYTSLFPSYGFEDHVGYGTVAHRQAIRQYGFTSIHRQSFSIHV